MKRTDAEKLVYRGLLTYSQAALYLGVSVGKVRMLILNKQIGESAPDRIAKAEIDRYLLRMAELYRLNNNKRNVS